MITADTLAQRLAGLDPIGVGRDHAVNRLAWTAEDEGCGAWFAAQAHALGCAVVRDPAGNRWATPAQAPPWWAVGSHLDSVRQGGRFDGPLGVACGFEIAAAAAAEEEPRPAILSFADEEGARFNTPTFGSKALTGRLDLAAVLARCDDAGTRLGEAMRAVGLDPDRIAETPGWLENLRGLIEIHIDQSTEIARAGAPVAVVRGLAGRTRLEADLRGRADHAGATPPEERRDALSAAAHLILAAEDLARREQPAGRLRVTTSRIEAEPNAATTIAARVRLWIDARAPTLSAIDRWRGALEQTAAGLSAATGVDVGLQPVSRSPGQEFDTGLRAALARACAAELGHDVPEVLCFAGHDAGILAERIPAAMLFVRNPTGVSHSPEERIDLADAAVAARVVQRALAEIDSRR